MKTTNVILFFCLTVLSVFRSNAQTPYVSPYNVSYEGMTSHYNLRAASGPSHYNTAVGAYSLSNDVGSTPVGTLTGSYNSAFGGYSLLFNTSGEGNCAYGYRALTSNTTGGSNVAVGYDAMRYSTTGSLNIGIGFQSLKSNSGNENIAIGTDAGLVNNSGNRNIYMGYNAGVSSSGENNVLIGSYADCTTGSFNTIMGPGAGVVTGSYNTFVGKAYANNVSNTIILADGNNSQRLYIHSDGKTGIGLGNNVIPSNMLEVKHGTAGNSGLRLTSLPSGNSDTSNSLGKVLTVNQHGDVILVNDAGGSGGGITSLTAGANITLTPTGSPVTSYQVAAQNLYTNDGTLTGFRTVTLDDKNLFFKTSQTDITKGKIYIGKTENYAVTTPITGNYKLFVEGGILTEKVKVALRSTTNWADYVFADNYKLMPLKEVETFVKENKHLPNIASAEDLVKEGLDLGDMQAKQMEKIEELTLYLIEQNKLLETQGKEIQELKQQVQALLNKK